MTEINEVDVKEVKAEEKESPEAERSQTDFQEGLNLKKGRKRIL